MRRLAIEFGKVAFVMLVTLLLIIAVLRLFGLWQYDDTRFYANYEWTFTVYNGTYNPLLESLFALQFLVILLLPLLLFVFRKRLKVSVAHYVGVVLALIVLLPLLSSLGWLPQGGTIIDRSLESELPIYIPEEIIVVSISSVGWLGGYFYKSTTKK